MKMKKHLDISRYIPKKGDSKGEVARKLLIWILIIILVFGICFAVSYYSDTMSSEKLNVGLQSSHKQAESKIVSSKTSSGGILPELLTFYRQNKELCGWITVPGTNIDYPVVQCRSDNENEKYLKTGFDGKKSRHGSIFLDFRDNIKPLSQDMIIYGHNMNDGIMFGQLTKYMKAQKNDYLGFYNSHPVIEFDTLYKRYKWKIFAVFATTGDSKYKDSIYYLNTEFPTQAKWDSFIKGVKERSFIDSKVDVKYSDTILTLSTCNYAYPRINKDWARLVIMARKVRDGEDESVLPASANKNVVYPEIWSKK